jgi:ADP-dependent NAD(P)H-hydrate dehydratase
MLAEDMAQRWNAVVALKGARTVIATPRGERWQHEGGNVGLATSGSGDVLAGIIAGPGGARRRAGPGRRLGRRRCMRRPASASRRASAGWDTWRGNCADEVPALLEQAAGDNADAASRPSGSLAGGLRVER